LLGRDRLQERRAGHRDAERRVDGEAGATCPVGEQDVDRAHPPAEVMGLEQHDWSPLPDLLPGLVPDVADVHAELVGERALEPDERRRLAARADPACAPERCDQLLQAVHPGRVLPALDDRRSRILHAVLRGRHEHGDHDRGHADRCEP
jgi:hypothetical protein